MFQYTVQQQHNINTDDITSALRCDYGGDLQRKPTSRGGFTTDNNTIIYRGTVLNVRERSTLL